MRPLLPASIRRSIVAALLGVLGTAGPTARAGDLDPAQAKTLATLTNYAKQIETNVQLAADGVGPGGGRPPEAKARLARSRLAQPKGMLVSVREALAKLPAGDAEVAALAARLTASDAAIAALERRLDGGAPGAPTGPTPAAPTARLDYRQRQALSDGEFHVRRVAGAAADLADLVRRVEAVADRDSIDHRLLRAGMGTIEAAGRSTVDAKGHLDPLPPEGEGVAAVVARLSTSLASIAASEAVLKPLHVRLSALVDPANYPALEDDLRRMQGLASMFREPAAVFASDPRRAAALVGEAAAAQAAALAFEKSYARLVAQQTDAGTRVDAASRQFRGAFDAFQAVAGAERTALPAAIEARIAEVRGMATTAVAEKKPAFFSGGIPDRVRELDARVELAAALEAEAGRRARAAVDALRAELATTEASLRDAIVDANGPPPDRYTAADRAELEQAAVAAWKLEQADAEVLAIRIPSEAWRRETLWRHENSSWRLVDRSTIQVQLVVRYDDRLAVVRPINLSMDHRSGDARTAFPLHALRETVTPGLLLRRDRLK